LDRIVSGAQSTKAEQYAGGPNQASSEGDSQIEVPVIVLVAESTIVDGLLQAAIIRRAKSGN
jgi:hypothetical protein